MTFGPTLPPSETGAPATSSASLPNEKVGVLEKAHTGPILAVRFNKDGNYCLTCGQDRLIKLWNPNKQLVVKSYIGHGHEVSLVPRMRAPALRRSRFCSAP